MPRSARQNRSSGNTRISPTDGLPVPSHPVFRRLLNDQHFSWDDIPAGSRLLLALSGGPDSTFLLYYLLFLAKKRGYQLGIAHVNHGTRGRFSDADERFVRDLGAQFCLPTHVRSFRPKHSRPNEESLRNARYRLLRRVASTHRYDFIITAHTKDDQAETVCERILRGAGPFGLAGILPRNGILLRPLLSVRKKDVLAYLADRHITFRVDRSNASRRFLRNRVRSQLLPLLETEYSPGIVDRLASLAEIAAETRQLLEDSPLAIPVQKTSAGLAFRLTDFQSLQPAERRFFLYRSCRALTPLVSSQTGAAINELEKRLLAIGSETKSPFRVRPLSIRCSRGIVTLTHK